MTTPATRFNGSVWVRGADAVNSHTTRWKDGCPDCRWYFVIACSGNSPGNEFDYKCAEAEDACPGEGILYTAYLTTSGPPAMVFGQVGDVCLGGAGQRVVPINLPALLQEAKDKLGVVAAAPIPGQRAESLVNLPTYFVASGDTVKTVDVGVDGFVLRMTAKPRYEWDFGDESTLKTTIQGRSYQSGDTLTPPGESDAIQHWYRGARGHTVTLQTIWHATFTMDGGPVQDVAEEVSPPAQSLAVNVLQARSTLYN